MQHTYSTGNKKCEDEVILCYPAVWLLRVIAALLLQAVIFVKLNLTSSVFDDGSPRETCSEDDNERLGRKCSLSGLAQLGDANAV